MIKGSVRRAQQWQQVLQRCLQDYREAIEKDCEKITQETIIREPEYKEIYEEKYATYRAVIDRLSSA